MKKRPIILVLIFLLGFSGVVWPILVIAEDPLLMGVFPRRSAKVTYKLFKPMANYLKEKLGREVRLETTKDFKTFWANIKNKRYDLVHYNQYHYIESHEKFGYKVILKNEEFGSATIAGAVAVRKDSGIKTVSDLKGKKIVFGGGRKAMMSYIVPRYLLEKAGLKKGDYKESFARNPPTAMLSAYYKDSDAAGVGEVVIRLGVVTKQIKTDELQYLITSEPIAHLPWAVNSDMSSDLASSIQAHMVALNNNSEGRKILKAAKLTGIATAKDEDFNPHREIAKSVFSQ